VGKRFDSKHQLLYRFDSKLTSSWMFKLFICIISRCNIILFLINLVHAELKVGNLNSDHRAPKLFS
jgi:hypothetical protein